MYVHQEAGADMRIFGSQTHRRQPAKVQTAGGCRLRFESLEKRDLMASMFSAIDTRERQSSAGIARFVEVSSNSVTASNSSVSIATINANQPEGDSQSTEFTFAVRRQGTLAGAVTLNFAVTGVGSNPAIARDFLDNRLPSGQVTLAAGQATAVITIAVKGENLVEANESFLVTLSPVTAGVSMGVATARGVIRNDDTALGIGGLIFDRPEGNAGVTPFKFNVVRFGVLTQTTTVNYVVLGNGFSNVRRTDFVGNEFPSGQVTFDPGQTTKVITIRILGDTTPEGDESFRVVLTDVSAGAWIQTSDSIGIIRNDDPPLAGSTASSDRIQNDSANATETQTASPVTIPLKQTGLIQGQAVSSMVIPKSVVPKTESSKGGQATSVQDGLRTSITQPLA